MKSDSDKYCNICKHLEDDYPDVLAKGDSNKGHKSPLDSLLKANIITQAQADAIKTAMSTATKSEAGDQAAMASLVTGGTATTASTAGTALTASTASTASTALIANDLV